jgi:hypothetical protein
MLPLSNHLFSHWSIPLKVDSNEKLGGSGKRLWKGLSQTSSSFPGLSKCGAQLGFHEHNFGMDAMTKAAKEHVRRHRYDI